MERKLATRNKSLKKYIVLSTLAIIALLIVFFLFDSKQQILQILEWLDSNESMAVPIFIFTNMLFVVLVLPGVFLTMGAGFMFGVLQGSIYVILSTTIGSSISFIIARYFFSARISDYFLCHPRLRLIDIKFSGTGWKGVFLTRLIPFFPFKLSNYFFGLASFSLRDFIFGSFFGIMPFTIFNVYIGSLAADLATLGVRNTERSLGHWLFYGLGFSLSIAALVFINYSVKKLFSHPGQSLKAVDGDKNHHARDDSRIKNGE